MYFEIAKGLVLPFFGTALGAAGVYLMKDKMNDHLQRTLSGFAAGVMTAAAVWSLILPALEQSEHMGKSAVIPVLIGFWAGIMFLMLLDRLIPHFHIGENQPEGPKSSFKKTTMMILAVALHNIPEGMAVGASYAEGLFNHNTVAAGAFTLSLGIALQNFPEGAIISMPLKSEGMSRNKAFLFGALSGVVEPIAALVTMLAAAMVAPVLPYLLSFAAGAMIYVVVEDLVPEMNCGCDHWNMGAVVFSLGFTLMIVLDYTLG